MPLSHPGVEESRLSHGPLAQLAEQRTFNPWVVGSSPTGPTPLGVEVELLAQHIDMTSCFHIVERMQDDAIRINHKR